MEKGLQTLLNSHGIMLKKAYGQNFLTDATLLKGIVAKAGLSENDSVLEIGCGAGALTKELADCVKTVYGYEIDARLKPVLQETLAGKDNVKLFFKDVMKESVEETEKIIGGDYVIVANLPYYITTPLIMRFLEKAKNVKRLVIMVQEEVALRLAAKPADSDYGAITVGVNLRGSASIIERVGREKFSPSPNVDSAVVRIDIDREKFNGVNLDRVRDVVRAAFSGRRKMLANNLINVYKMTRVEAENALSRAGINLTARGETLSAEDFVRLTEIIYG